MSKSMSRGFRMVKGGRESLRPCYGRPKLTLIKKKQVLKRHLNSVLKDLYRVSVKEDIKCEKCGKSFTRKDYLYAQRNCPQDIQYFFWRSPENAEIQRWIQMQTLWWPVPWEESFFFGGRHDGRQNMFLFVCSWLTCCCTGFPTRWPEWWRTWQMAW